MQQLLLIDEPDLPREILTLLLDSRDGDVVIAALTHPDVTERDVDRALRHDDARIRRAAVINEKASAQRLAKCLRDPDEMVATAARNVLTLRHPENDDGWIWEDDEAVKERQAKAG